MNGIDPPTPMSTGSVPSQASVNAPRAASYAGPVASIWVASPVSTTVTVSSAPHGTCASRWALQAGQGVLGGVAGGDPHRDLGAGGRHQGVAGAVDLGGVEAGDAQRRLGPQPLDRRAARRSTRCRGRRRTRRAAAPRGTRRRRPGRCAGPATATLPRVVVQAGDQPAQRDQRVGHQAAPHAGVDGVGERADLDVDADQAAQAGGERRHADVPVAGVGDDDDVGAELVLVLARAAPAGCRSRPPPRPR